MEKEEKKSEVVEEKVSEATEEIAKPTPYKHPDRGIMEKEVETSATEESKEKPDEDKPKDEHPEGVEKYAVYKKRYDDLKRHYDETNSKNKDEILKLKKEIEAISSKPVFKSPEEIEEWRREYPEMYESVMQLTTEATLKSKQDMEEQLLEVKKQQAQIAKDKAEVELSKKHPDYKELADDDDFQGWTMGQPKYIKEIIDKSFDAKEISRVIDLYKYDRGISAKKVSNSDVKKEAAKSVSKTKPSETPSEKKQWSWAKIQKMKPHEYAKFEDEIDKAHREGRIV
tara:strand:+ start:609 stop:1460 length:852 start_codon:yes stop_codon:yes gene_type:complete